MVGLATEPLNIEKFNFNLITYKWPEHCQLSWCATFVKSFSLNAFGAGNLMWEKLIQSSGCDVGFDSHFQGN